MHPGRIATTLFLAFAVLPSRLLACTPALGVDREAFYRAIALPGRVASLISWLAAVGWFVVTRRRGGRRSWLLFALAVLNPGWLLWDIGDCGSLAFWVGGVFALLSLGVLGTGLRQRRLSRAVTAAPGV